MRLGSDGSGVVDLRIRGYQFPNLVGDDAAHSLDANWLVVRGEVCLADGRSWAFEEPCLTTCEAESLSAWLRGVAIGSTAPTPFDRSDEDHLLVFTEPNLALSLHAYGEHHAVLRVHLSLESLPPWLRRGDRTEIYEYFVPFEMPICVLMAAVERWDDERAKWPPR